MKRITKVMNVITEETHSYYNGNDLESNLISAIIYSTEDRRKLLEDDYREQIKDTAKIEMITSFNGSQKAYSPVYDMIAYKVN